MFVNAAVVIAYPLTPHRRACRIPSPGVRETVRDGARLTLPLLEVGLVLDVA